jgi:hypothetical protein
MTNTVDGAVVANSTYSNIAWYDDVAITAASLAAVNNVTIATGYGGEQMDAIDTVNTYFNFDFTSFNSTSTVSKVCLVSGTPAAGDDVACGDDFEYKGLAEIASPSGLTGGLSVNVTFSGSPTSLDTLPFVADVFSFGAGVNNAIYRLQLEESGDNTATFEGTVEYHMLNQLNINLDSTYTDLYTIDSDIDIIVEQDMTDEDSPRINYFDLGADGVSTQIADQEAAPTHNGVVSFDMENYKIADTVVVTLDDQDMNYDSELVDVYVTKADDRVGDNTDAGLVLDITFDDLTWVDATEGSCTGSVTGDDGLNATGFTLVETGTDTGIFVGSFQVPSTFCNTSSDTIVGTTGTDIEVNYQDFRNASGESIEVGAGASINANTGSVAFDRSVIQFHTVILPECNSKHTLLMVVQLD